MYIKKVYVHTHTLLYAFREIVDVFKKAQIINQEIWGEILAFKCSLILTL